MIVSEFRELENLNHTAYKKYLTRLRRLQISLKNQSYVPIVFDFHSGMHPAYTRTLRSAPALYSGICFGNPCRFVNPY